MFTSIGQGAICNSREALYVEDFLYVSDQVDCERRTPSTDHIYMGSGCGRGRWT
jgi:hypothetical protein